MMAYHVAGPTAHRRSLSRDCDPVSRSWTAPGIVRAAVAAFKPHIIVAFCCLASYQPAIAEDEKDAIFNAWRQRQEQIHSLHFEWDQVTRKLSMPDAGEQDDDAAPDVSSQNWDEVTQQGAFRMSGEKIDYRMSSEERNATRTPAFIRGSFDGSVSRRYGTQPPGGTQTGTGYLDSAPHAYGVREVEVVPLLLTYRPLHPAVGKIDPERAEVLPETRQIGEHECRILQTTSPRKIINSYWTDPQRDYVILRYTSAYQGHESTRLDIEYEDDQTHGWVPKKWKHALMDDEGRPTVTKEAVMTHFELNTTIPDSEFTFDFPDGTLVIVAQDVESIIVALLTREAWFRGYAIEWKERRITAKGGLLREGAAFDDEVSGPVPPEEVDEVVNFEFRFYEDHFRSRNDASANFEGSVYPSSQTLRWSDGRLMSLTDSREFAPFRYHGQIEQRATQLAAAGDYRVVLAHFRPSFGGEIELLRNSELTGSKYTAEGHEVNVLRLPSMGTTAITELWIDMENGGLIRRWVTSLPGGRELASRTVSYEMDPELSEWKPSGWEYVSYWPDGELQFSHATSGEVIYTPIDDLAEIPDIEFPPGTLVVDATPQAEHQQFFVRPDGTRRPIVRNEFPPGVTVTPELLARTEPGQALSNETAPMQNLLTIGLVILVCFVALAALQRHRGQR